MNYHKSPFHANLQRSSVRPSAAVTLDHKEHKKYVLKLAKRGSDKLYPFDSIFRLFNGLVSHPRKRSINLFGKHCNNPLTHNNIHPSSSWILYREMILCSLYRSKPPVKCQQRGREIGLFVCFLELSLKVLLEEWGR